MAKEGTRIKAVPLEISPCLYRVINDFTNGIKSLNYSLDTSSKPKKQCHTREVKCDGTKSDGQTNDGI